jgi:hypothetical protein
MNDSLVPVVVETSRGQRSFDIYSRLLKDRIVPRGETFWLPPSSVIDPRRRASTTFGSRQDAVKAKVKATA